MSAWVTVYDKCVSADALRDAVSHTTGHFTIDTRREQIWVQVQGRDLLLMKVGRCVWELRTDDFRASVEFNSLDGILRCTLHELRDQPAPVVVNSTKQDELLLLCH